jgi:prolyl-tRNA synthetase
MGGKLSHEFMAAAALGEDIVLFCSKCKLTLAFKEEVGICPACHLEMAKINTLEVGHIFKLGTKYSQALQANFSDGSGQLKPLVMGCYGIGVSRLIPAIIEQNNDIDGIIWPGEVAPFQIIILPLDTTNQQLMQTAESFYQELKANGFEVLFDDRNERAGVKFKDADLLGIPLQVVIGRNSLVEQTIEIKVRSTKEKIIKPRLEAIEQINRLIRI